VRATLLCMKALFHSSSQYSWRAITFSATLVALASTLLFLDKLTGDQWVSVVQWIGSTFVVAEAGRKFAPSAAATGS